MNQKQVWGNISEEWNKFKITPAEHVMEFLKNKKGKILDLGSGSGRHLISIEDGKMYLVDFSKKMIELAKKKAKEKNIEAEFSVSDLRKLPFQDNFFDFAIAIAVFHCLKPKSQEKAAKELFRVMKKGAKAEIVVWNKNSRRFRNAEKEKFVKWREKGERYYYLFDEKEIHDLFKKVGFKIVSREEPQRSIIFVVKKPIN